MPKFKTGDVFAIELPDKQYCFGRVMLDVHRQCVKPKLIPADSPLGFSGSSVLIEIYKQISAAPRYEPSPLLIAGAFAFPLFLKDGHWPIVAFQEVDPKTVEFPEALVPFEHYARFRRGEIVLPLDLDRDDLERIGVRPTVLAPVRVPKICAYYLGMTEVFEDSNPEAFTLKTTDLRFSAHRSRIYGLLDEDEGASYCEMSRRLGYDITRFYR